MHIDTALITGLAQVLPGTTFDPDARWFQALLQAGFSDPGEALQRPGNVQTVMTLSEDGTDRAMVFLERSRDGALTQLALATELGAASDPEALHGLILAAKDHYTHALGPIHNGLDQTLELLAAPDAPPDALACSFLWARSHAKPPGAMAASQADYLSCVGALQGGMTASFQVDAPDDTDGSRSVQSLIRFL